MRVLLVNTSARTGGAAIAASRLLHALCNNGHHAKMLVMNKDTDDISVAQASTWLWRKVAFVAERLMVLLHIRRREGLWDIDPAWAGVDITRTREFREADVVHLHWVNQGMLSLRGIRRVKEAGKPVVMTMHDMWAMTGLCHYAHDCQRWRNDECRNCPLPGCRTWAHEVWMQKQRTWRGITFVGCSEWIADLARQSGLLRGNRVMAIPNAIDVRVFSPEGDVCVELPRDKRVILFAAQKVTDPRKGMTLLVKALQRLPADDMVVAVLGAKAEALAGQIPQRVYALGYQDSAQRIAAIYRAAAVYVTPSLSDNLPNTIMEAMACGVPCVGYAVGGIPEMIDHRVNGYVAQAASPDDLAAGIADVLAHRDQYAAEAVHKVHQHYMGSRVAALYEQCYEAAAQRSKFAEHIIDGR